MAQDGVLCVNYWRQKRAACEYEILCSYMCMYLYMAQDGILSVYCWRQKRGACEWKLYIVFICTYTCL